FAIRRDELLPVTRSATNGRLAPHGTSRPSRQSAEIAVAMGRFFTFLWAVLVIGLVVFLGQTMGFYHLPWLDSLASTRFPGQTVAAAPTTESPSPQRTLVQTTRPTPGPLATPSGSDICTPTTPRYVHGMADLKAIVGSDMGDPLECERIVDGDGNTEQRTSTGLAYYRAKRHLGASPDGERHWAPPPRGAVQWSSDAVEPPTDAVAIP